MVNFEKKILAAVGLLIIIVLAIGAIVFRQQQIINSLSGKASSKSSKIKKIPQLSDTIKIFSGKIENISGSQLTINTVLTDFSKPKDSGKLKNTSEPVNLSADDFEKLEKKITVNSNNKTIFEGKNLVDLKVGDVVSVTSDKSPYTPDTVTAEKITYSRSPNVP